jgi:hypothetical protein
MKFIYKGFFVICCLFAALLVLAAFLPRPTQSAAATPVPAEPLRTAAIAQKAQPAFPALVLAQIGRQSPKWQEIRFDNDNSAKSYALTISYRRTPSGYGEVEVDTKRVARAVLRTLVANGRNPHAKWISVFVRGQQPETGETGADLVRMFGETHYDFNDDQLVFEATR